MSPTRVVFGVVAGVDVAGLLKPALASTDEYLTPTTCHTSTGGLS